MAGAKNFVFRQVAQILSHHDDPAVVATTLTANAAAGATSVTVASITGLSSGDTFRVGSGNDVELNKINGAPSGGVVTLTFPLAKAHVIGEQARRQITYDRGDLDETGVKVTIESDTVDVNPSTRRLVLTRLDGYVRAFFEAAFPSFTLNNLVFALQMLLSRITGAGTSSSPFQLSFDGSAFGEDVNTSLSVYGTLVDGSSLLIELHGYDMDQSVVKTTFKRGELATIPFKAKLASQIAFSTVAPTYTVNSTLKANKGQIFDAPSEVGFYTPAGSGVNTTLTALAAAGATSLVVAASTGGASGDRLKINTSDQAEIRVIDTVPDGTHLATRDQLFRAQASGTTVVEQTQTPFGGLSEDGVDLEFTADGRDVKLATQRVEGGRIPGNATIAASFSVVDFILANVAYALAIAQSQIVSNRLIAGNNIGAADLTEVYFRGLAQNGMTTEIDLCGCSQTIENFAPTLNNKDIAKLPLKVLPASCITFRQW
jgi:hypothetical protein